MYIYIYTYIHIALWHVWIEPDSLDLASMKAYMCRYLYIHFIIVCISAYAAPDVHARNLRSTQLYSCWSLQKPIRNPWKSADLCPYVYLVGGFNPSEKYEFVNGKDYPIYYGKYKMFQTTNQYIYNLFPAGQATGGPGGPAIDDPVVYSRSTLWAGQHVPSGVLRDADGGIIGSNESNPWWMAVSSPFNSFKIYWPWLWGLCTMYSENLSMSSHGLPK